MKRKHILELLHAHQPFNDTEKVMLHEMILFIQKNPDCFERSLLKGHVTGSAWILNADRTHVLLLHHAKLDKWLQPGGHCDGDPDVLLVAAKETEEETGLKATPIKPQVFDVDNHIIPERKGVPEHIHYDIRFLFQVEKGMEEVASNHESISVRWIRLEEVRLYNDSLSVMRMVEKIVAQ